MNGVLVTRLASSDRHLPQLGAGNIEDSFTAGHPEAVGIVADDTVMTVSKRPSGCVTGDFLTIHKPQTEPVCA